MSNRSFSSEPQFIGRSPLAMKPRANFAAKIEAAGRAPGGLDVRKSQLREWVSAYAGGKSPHIAPALSGHEPKTLATKVTPRFGSSADLITACPTLSIDLQDCNPRTFSDPRAKAVDGSAHHLKSATVFCGRAEKAGADHIPACDQPGRARNLPQLSVDRLTPIDDFDRCHPCQ